MLIFEVDGLKLENTSLREEQQKFEKEFGKLKDEDDKQKDEIKNLKSNLTAEQKLSEKIRLELSTSQSENDRLRAELEKLQKNLDTLELANDKLNSEVEDLKKTSIDAQNKVNALQYHVAALLEEKEALLNELDSLRAEVSRLGKVVSDKVAKEAIEKKAIVSNGELMEKLKAELDKMRVENESLKHKLNNDVNKRYASLKDENAALKIENIKITTELNLFKSDLTRAKNDLDKSKNQNNELKAEIDKLKKVLGDAETKIKFLEGQLVDLPNEKVRLEKEMKVHIAISKFDDVHAQLDDLINALDAKKIDKAALKNALIQLQDDLNKYRADNERLAIELAASEAIQRERTKYDKERQDLQNLMIENKELRDELKMAQNMINKLKENIKKSKGDFIEDIDSFENELKKSMIEIDKARVDLRYAAEENTKLKMINDSLELELGRLKTLLNEIKDYLEQVGEEVNGTKDQIQRLLAANNALKIENMELKSRLNHCQTEKEHLNDEINNLSEKIKFLQSLPPIIGLYLFDIV